MENKENFFDVVIVGAGPAGLEAGLQAKKRGLKYLLIEKEDAGSLITQTMLNKRFYHKYGDNKERPKGLLYFPDRINGQQLVDGWGRQARKLNYRHACALQNLASDGNKYIVKTNAGNFLARNIIIATGAFEKPRVLGVSGEANNPRVFYQLDYDKIPLDEKVVVVGGGNSAVETALESALDNEVILVVRNDKLASNLSGKNKAELENNKEIKIFWRSKVVKINRDNCELKTPQGKLQVPFDTLYINIGYDSPIAWLKSFGIKTDSRGKVRLDKTFQTSLPRVFVIGALTGADSIVQSANQAISVISRIAKLG